MIKTFNNWIKIALLVSAFFAFTPIIRAQKDWLEILPGATKLSYDSKTDKQRLIGALSFKYQGNTMFCDSAHVRYKTKELWVYGKVQINKADTLNLYCDSLYYNGKQRKAKLWGNVRVRDREYKLTTDTLEYDAKITQAIYRNGGKIENITNKEVLTSQVGYMNPNTEESFFKGNVVYKSPQITMKSDTLQYNYLKHRVSFFGHCDIVTKDTKMVCSKGWYDVNKEEGVLQSNAKVIRQSKEIQGDSLYYSVQKKLAIGSGNIFMKDTAQKLTLRGQHVISDELNRYDQATGDPLIELQKGKDTLYIHADTILHKRDSLLKSEHLLAHQHVNFFQKDAQGKADSLDLFRPAQQMHLFGKPIFWSNNSELHGDTITVFLKNDTIIEKVFLRENAFATNEVDSTGLYNQLSGRSIWAYFKKDPKRGHELIKGEVLGNATTLFYPIDEEKTDSSKVVHRKGMNLLSASSLVIYLDSGEVKRATFIGKPDGTFYPMSEIDPTIQFLKGFSWNPALRPKKPEDLLLKTPTIGAITNSSSTP